MTPKETAWTTYWQSNRLDSCIVRKGQHQEDQQAIFDFWRAFVEEMPKGCHLLDLATGNGAVALRLLEAANAVNKPIMLKAVDLADIQPEAFLTDFKDLVSQVEFRGLTDICALPFANQYFDGVVSQFGFEYAEHAPAVAELARVLKPGGRFQLLIHHQAGALVAPNVAQVSEIETLLRPGGLVDCIQQLLAGTAQMDRLDDEGRRLLSEHGNQLPRITAEIFAAVRQLLSRRDLDLATRVQGASDMRSRLEAEKERMQQLDRAALSEPQAGVLKEIMLSAGLKDVTYQPFHVGSDKVLLGWQFTGRR